MGYLEMSEPNKTNPTGSQPENSIDTKKDMGSSLRFGQPCPACGSTDVHYDGQLNLVCKNCGLKQSRAFT
ncbi:MAG: hypothetical protein AAGU15_03590 [Anaerolineaceae bacterium]